MPLPNGVDPSGQIEAVCPSAAYLGNRGRLHKGEPPLVIKAWSTKSWVTCSLHFKDRRRSPLMRPGSYTELFFLDEATSLAAGHRPCGECRREHYRRFKAFWSEQNGSTTTKNIDQALHAERVDAAGKKILYPAAFSELPNGVMFQHEGNPYLKWQGQAKLWTAAGYLPIDRGFDSAQVVNVLTPRTVVKILSAGHPVQVHPSATSGGFGS
jgi:hypothetical protein